MLKIEIAFRVLESVSFRTEKFKIPEQKLNAPNSRTKKMINGVDVPPKP